MRKILLSLPAIVLCLLIAATAIVLNQPSALEDLGSSSSSAGAGGVLGQSASVRDSASPVRQRIAGWPFRYFVQCTYADGPPAIYYRTSSFVANVVCFVLLILFFAVYEARVTRKTRQAAERSGTQFRRQFTLSDMVLLVTLVALIAGYWQSIGGRAAHERRQLAKLPANKVVVVQSSLVPHWLHGLLPASSERKFQRVRELELSDPIDDDLRLALSFDTLQSLKLTDGKYDLKLLDQLRNLPLLHRLQVAGRKLSPQAVAAIASCKQLQSLNLMRTNITAAGVRALGDMPRLRALNLVHTDVKLSEFRDLPISKTLTSLALPHPDRGTGDELVLEAWPELQVLSIVEYDTQSNPEPVKVVLRDLPALNQLLLDRFQLFDLTLDRVPQLNSIAMSAFQAEMRSKSTDQPTTSAWLKRLKVHQSSIPIMLPVQPLSLEEIDIDSPLQVNLKITHSPTTAMPIREHFQRLIDQVGDCRGIESLDLSGLDLRDVSLDRLARNQFIRNLNLSQTQIKPGELLKLATMKLKSLSVMGLAMGTAAITDVIKAMPNLERLEVEPVRFAFVPMENSNIRDIGSTANVNSSPRISTAMAYDSNAIGLGRAHLVNLPNFITAVSFPNPLQSVRIENVPRLVRLRFEFPLPPDSILRGLSDLQAFAAGGLELTDEHFDAIAKCDRLRSLSLLYTSITSEKLKQVGGLAHLNSLILTGSAVTDEVIAAWKPIQQLRTLQLDDTQITGASLLLLPKKFPVLEKLTIDAPATKEQVLALAQCKYLTELSLRNSEISAEALKELAKLPSLAKVDFSNSRFDTAATKELRQFISKAGEVQLNNAVLDPGDEDKEFAERIASQVDPTATRSTMPTVIYQGNSSQLRFNVNGGTTIILDADEVWTEPFRRAAEKNRSGTK